MSLEVDQEFLDLVAGSSIGTEAARQIIASFGDREEVIAEIRRRIALAAEEGND